MASASFEIDPGTGIYGPAGVAQDAAASVVVNCRLVSVVGVNPSLISWRCFGTHAAAQAALVPTLSGSPSGQIASFTLPAGLAQAYGIECTVNGGPDVTGDNNTRALSAVYVLDANGKRPFFVSETVERQATHGTTEILNEILLAAFAALAGGYSSIEDEGVPLPTRTTINFVGAGVVASDAGGKTVVTIPVPVPSPANPADDGKMLFAAAGAYALGANLITDGSTYLSIGATPAAGGALRLANNQSISWDAAGAGDVAALTVDGSDIVQVGSTTHTTRVRGSAVDFYIGGSRYGAVDVYGLNGNPDGARATLGGYTADPASYSGIYCGVVPGASNYALLGNGASSYVNAPTASVFLQLGGLHAVVVGGQGGLTGASVALVAVTGGVLTTAAGQAVAFNAAGQFVLQGNSGVAMYVGTALAAHVDSTAFWFDRSTVQWEGLGVTPLLTQETRASGNAASLTIHAQETDSGDGGSVNIEGSGAAGAGTNGGGITLKSGAIAGGFADVVLKNETGGNFFQGRYDGTQRIGLFGAAPAAQPADMVTLTDSTTGAPGTTINDGGGVYSQATTNDNNASLLTQINKVRAALRSLGLMA